MKKIKILLLLLYTVSLSVPSISQSPTPLSESDFVIKDFKFASGELLPQLNIHYATLGQPVKNNKGEITNAVLIMHGTTGNGRQFLRPQFANNLYNRGQLLDTTKFFLVLPDAIGHGKSSKPSDGLHMRFP